LKKNISPCGADCAACEKYPNTCKGCREIEGKVWFLVYTGQTVCDIYDCCVNSHAFSHCGKCPKFPCPLFSQGDPNKSDEENLVILESQIANLLMLD